MTRPNRRGARLCAAFAGLALALTLAPPRAAASTALALDLPALTARADLVVRGTVRARSVSRSADGRRLTTSIALEVAETLKGAAPKVVTIGQPGGELDGIVQAVSGAPRWSVGEEVVVFLRQDAPQATRVVGLALGRFSVLRGTSSVRVVPSSPDGLLLVDPASGRPAPSRLEPLGLETFRRTITALVATRSAR